MRRILLTAAAVTLLVFPPSAGAQRLIHPSDA
jgi:hypothetical protein